MLDDWRVGGCFHWLSLDIPCQAHMYCMSCNLGTCLSSVSTAWFTGVGPSILHTIYTCIHVHVYVQSRYCMIPLAHMHLQQIKKKKPSTYIHIYIYPMPSTYIHLPNAIHIYTSTQCHPHIYIYPMPSTYTIYSIYSLPPFLSIHRYTTQRRSINATPSPPPVSLHPYPSHHIKHPTHHPPIT